ncbi:MAG: CarD family transcriptional regulator [Oligoflexales bacterium]|nr:CarD family transcriptional regulator [Oligoflexales bacterium]
MGFMIGDKAVYPSHGVGVIKKIESKEVAGKNQDFYVLQIISSGLRFMVPTNNYDRVGMRSLISDIELDKIREILRTPNKINKKNWNRRFREFNVKLATGRLDDIAEVLRDLICLREMKELSFGERKMMEKARELIISEISQLTNRVNNEVEQDLDQWLV